MCRQNPISVCIHRFFLNMCTSVLNKCILNPVLIVYTKCDLLCTASDLNMYTGDSFLINL